VSAATIPAAATIYIVVMALAALRSMESRSKHPDGAIASWHVAFGSAGASVSSRTALWSRRERDRCPTGRSTGL
jgi:hypothetical protein